MGWRERFRGWTAPKVLTDLEARGVLSDATMEYDDAARWVLCGAELARTRHDFRRDPIVVSIRLTPSYGPASSLDAEWRAERARHGRVDLDRRNHYAVAQLSQGFLTSGIGVAYSGPSARDALRAAMHAAWVLGCTAKTTRRHSLAAALESVQRRATDAHYVALDALEELGCSLRFLAPEFHWKRPQSPGYWYAFVRLMGCEGAQPSVLERGLPWPLPEPDPNDAVWPLADGSVFMRIRRD